MYAVDILNYEHELKAAGVPEKQACVHASRIAQIIDNNLATKQDCQTLETKIDSVNSKIDSVNSKLHWLMNLVTTLGIALTVIAFIRPFIHFH